MWTIVGILVFIVLPAGVVAEILRCVYLEYRRDRIPILLYHRFLCKTDVEAGCVRDDEMIWVCYDTSFAEQMRYLAEAGYTTLDLDDYVRIRKGDMGMPEKPVVITCDDGYVSNFRMAFPEWKKWAQKAVIFIPPEPDDYTRQKVEGVDGFVTESQIREMSESGVSIQSHTLTHCVLADLDDEVATYELTESRQRLEAMTGRPVRHIAIPRAGYSRRVRRLVAQAGYDTACCNNKGSTSGRSDPLALPRIVIERDMTLQAFARALTPRSTVMLRIVGNIKRIPERIGGVHLAMKIRRVLYHGPFRRAFETRNLKKLILLGGVLYLLACVWFLGYLLLM